MRGIWLSLAAAIMLLPAAGAHAQTVSPCPEGLPAGAICHSGQDANGAYYWTAKPADWNGVLVLHAHGGPRLSAPKPDSSVADLKRFAEMVGAGYAWGGTSYRRGGYGVRMAVEDVDTLRRLYITASGQPKLIIVHGQSWGGNVAAKLIELQGKAADGKPDYDGALLTSGVLGGGTHGYDYRADLRAVYQYYCHNHPRADEPQYPLWSGLPADSEMKRKELETRVTECTGVGLPADQRNDAQKRNLANITAVTRIPERTLVAHLAWATFLFRDLVQKRLDGRNPFSNEGVRYAGSDDDDALNRDVIRFSADPKAVAELADDSDLTGKITVPVLTMHAIDDPTAFVEHESAYRDAVQSAGAADRLVQLFTRENVHSKLNAPQYPAALNALRRWIEQGDKPTAAAVADACEQLRADYPGECRFAPDFQPAAYNDRVYPRGRP